jgi:hypothetical protein
MQALDKLNEFVFAHVLLYIGVIRDNASTVGGCMCRAGCRCGTCELLER